jgi:NAD(P)-dependent dehydrogenase (short-subunit alcohol dehydrogenase family)
MNPFSLKDKVALITGASKGIGKSIAHSLAEAGAHVIVSSRKQEAVQKVADEISKAGGSAAAYECHVAYKDQLENLVHETTKNFGGVDILINNAATNPLYAALEDFTEEAYDKIMQVNLKSVMRLSNLCHSSMKKRGGGSVINIASVEGIKPTAGLSIYSVSKAALIMLTKAQAREWGKDKIRSNAICPGLIKTKFSQAIWSNSAFLDNFVSSIPAGRMAEPDELSGLALLLASDASSYLTGGVYTADGGYLV